MAAGARTEAEARAEAGAEAGAGVGVEAEAGAEETNFVNRRRVHGVVLQQTARSDVVHLDGIIGPGGGHTHAVRVEGHLVTEPLGLVECVHAALSAGVPDAHRPVVGAAGKEATVRGEPADRGRHTLLVIESGTRRGSGYCEHERYRASLPTRVTDQTELRIYEQIRNSVLIVTINNMYKIIHLR